MASIHELRVLGRPQWDNALYIDVTDGKQHLRVLIDCGDGCAAELGLARLRKLDALLLSHLHIDHVSGFDAFFRATYENRGAPLPVFGPLGTRSILHHRFRGYLWNLLGPTTQGAFQVHDVLPAQLRASVFRASDAFEAIHAVPDRPFDGTLMERGGARVEARFVQHKGPCLAYAVVIPAQQRLSKDKMRSLGLPPGPWCATLTDPGIEDSVPIELAGRRWTTGELRSSLLIASPGLRVAWATDLLLDERSEAAVLDLARDADVLVAECSYRHADLDRAAQHHHLTTRQIGRLAKRAGVGELILQHVSSRYDHAELPALLDEVRVEFPKARFPEGWATTT